MKIGSHVRDIRNRRRLTIEQPAGKTGLSNPYISQMETGKASPSLQTLEKLATALAVPMSSLFVDPEVACEVIRQGERQVVTVGTRDGSTQKRVEILSAPNRQLAMLVHRLRQRGIHH